MDGDSDRMRAWLRQPQARLGHRTPLAALHTSRQAVVVEQWIAALWLGEGD